MMIQLVLTRDKQDCKRYYPSKSKVFQRGLEKFQQKMNGCNRK